MKMYAGIYDCNPETASEFPHGPIIEMDDGKHIYFDLYMEDQAEICFNALSDPDGFIKGKWVCLTSLDIQSDEAPDELIKFEYIKAAPDLPMAAEGNIGQSYGEAK